MEIMEWLDNGKNIYKNRFSASELTHHTPDYVALAESMGATGLRMIEKSDSKKKFLKKC